MMNTKKHTLAFCAMSVAVAIACGQTVKTTRPGRMKPVAEEADERGSMAVVAADSVSLDSIVVSRYDKPLRSLRETFFVTNLYADTLTAVGIQFRYDTTDGTMLHQRSATVECEIPPGETRQLYLTAWDRQFTYYYHATRIQPKSSRAVAYEATLTPLTVGLKRKKTASK